MTPLVSLCVPTYNRAALLHQSLEAILSQITPAMQEAVEVVVLDNASPDHTPAVVAQAQADFPDAPVRYIRQPENIGCDANFCDAPHQARGTFVYLLSDDDVLLPGGVARLLELIGKHPDLDAFSLNVYEFWDTPDEEADEEAVSRACHFTGPDHILRGRDEVLPPLNSLLIFISCFAFRRENVLGRDYAPYYNTNMAQAYMFLDALAPGRGLYTSQRPYLARRTDNHQGYDFFRVFVTNWAALMRHARRLGYSRQAVRQAQVKHLKFLRYCILLFKYRGVIGTIRPDYRDGLARLWRGYGSHPLAALGISLMMMMPAPLFRGLHHAYQRVKAVVRPGTARQAPPSMQNRRRKGAVDGV